MYLFNENIIFSHSIDVILSGNITIARSLLDEIVARLFSIDAIYSI